MDHESRDSLAKMWNSFVLGTYSGKKVALQDLRAIQYAFYCGAIASSKILRETGTTHRQIMSEGVAFVNARQNGDL